MTRTEGPGRVCVTGSDSGVPTLPIAFTSDPDRGRRLVAGCERRRVVKRRVGSMRQNCDAAGKADHSCENSQKSDHDSPAVTHTDWRRSTRFWLELRLTELCQKNILRTPVRRATGHCDKWRLARIELTRTGPDKCRSVSHVPSRHKLLLSQSP